MPITYAAGLSLAIITSYSRETTCFHPSSAVNLRPSTKTLVHRRPLQLTPLALRRRGEAEALCLFRTSSRPSTTIRVLRLQAAPPAPRPPTPVHRPPLPVHLPPLLHPVVHQARPLHSRAKVIAAWWEPAQAAAHRLHPLQCGARVAHPRARVTRRLARVRRTLIRAALHCLHPQKVPLQKTHRLRARRARLARLPMHPVTRAILTTRITSRMRDLRARHHP